MGVSSSEPSQHRSSCSDSSFSPSLSPPPLLRPILRWPTPTGSPTDTATLALPVTPPPTLATPPLPTLDTLPLLPLLPPSLPPLSPTEPPLPTDSDSLRPPPTSLPPLGPSLRLPSLSRSLSPSSSGATRLPTKQQPAAAKKTKKKVFSQKTQQDAKQH